MTSTDTARERRELEENERHDDVYHPIELDRVNPVITDEQRSLFGLDPSQWVYCCRCDQAISLEERASIAFYRPGRGLMHGRCPRPGTAPRVPAKERAGRVAQFARARA